MFKSNFLFYKTLVLLQIEWIVIVMWDTFSVAPSTINEKLQKSSSIICFNTKPYSFLVQVLSANMMYQLGLSDWELSADMQYLLIRKTYNSVFRR